MIHAIERTLRERWSDLSLSGRPPARMQLHLDSRDPRPHGFVTFRAFRSGDPTPICVGRIPRDGIGARDALHEHELLERLREEAPRIVHRLVPRPLFVVERGARIATARTVLPGERASRAVRRLPGREARIDAALEIAERWLGAFGRATGLLEGTEGALWEPFLRSTLFEYGSVPADHRALLDELAAAIQERRRGVLLCGFGHGALSLSSFRVDGDRIGVEDWEHGKKRTAPWVDPIHFAWDLALRELGDATESANAIADPDHAIGRFVRDCLEDTGVPAEVLPLAMPSVALAAAHRVDRDGPATLSAATWREAALAAASLHVNFVVPYRSS